MSFEYQIDYETKVVSLIFDETTSYEEGVRVLDELVEILKKMPYLNIILDVSNFEIHLADEEKMHWGEMLASKKEFFKKSKTAVITNKALECVSLILVSAYTNGFERITEFGNRKEAILWLNDEII